jgi:enoyl-CoA hydratase/carnithine racemase
VADLLIERVGDALVLTLNRPEKRNAITLEMVQLLEEGLDRAGGDSSLRAMVITGAGSKCFCPGIDVGIFHEHVLSKPTGEQLRRVQRRVQELFCRIEQLEKPTIAAIEGACVSGGMDLALACDLRVCSSAAQLGFVETKRGIIPDLGGTTRMARLVGPAIAKEWIFTARLHTPEVAYELGLINELVEPGQAREKALALAAEIAENAPLAIGWAKRVIDRGLSMSLWDSLELEQDAMTELLPSEDVKEGLLAFLERRRPRFRGR